MGGIHVGKGVFIDPHADRWFTSTHPALTLRPANGNPSAPERHIVSRASRLAICITGLQRTYPEIGRNIERVLLHRTDRPYLFGVRPAGMWPDVKLRFDVVEDQRHCLGSKVCAFTDLCYLDSLLNSWNSPALGCNQFKPV